MSDRYRERWERRQAKWQARQAKWEARAARHEAYRVGYEARRAARMARLANMKSGTAGVSSHQPPPQAARTVFGLLGGLLILLGVMAVLLPGFGGPASPFVCLAPGVALLIPWLLWRRSSSRMPAVEAGQATHQVADTQGEKPVPVSAVKPQAAPIASAAPSRPAEQSQPKASESSLDPEYYRERAAGYRRRLQSIIRNRRPGPLADVMSSVVINLQQWEERVGELADRLTTFERDAIIQRDIKEVPANIARLRGQIEIEHDEGLHEQMQRTLAGYQSQQAMLDTLVRLMRRTRLMLDDTLVAMGTIYSQIRVIDASDIDNVQTTRIAEELDEQVKRLNDLLSALGDAYRGANPPDELADDAKRIQMQRGSAAGA
jgi:hypothetical protein